MMSNGDLRIWIKRIYDECEDGIEKSIPTITIWHHEACRVMTNGDHEGWIFLSPNMIKRFFFLLTIYVGLRLPGKFLNMLRCDMI